ncbi:histidine phosphatase family protein [Actinokineospora sp. NPDC004072]
MSTRQFPTATLVLIAHLPTAATRVAAFPDDEPVERPVAVAAPRVDLAVRGPEVRCADTARCLGLAAEPVAALRDLDAGAWRGRELAQVDAAEVGRWVADPAVRAPGGESVADVVARVATWLAQPPLARRVAAITHPAVMRAALLHTISATDRSFWRIDVSPGAQIVLRGGPGRWTALFR